MSPPTPTPKPNPTITLSTALPADLHALATLECLTFYDDSFSVVAWGPNRASEQAISGRASQFASSDAAPAEGTATEPRGYRTITKATLGETSEIVGFAEWKFSLNRDVQKEKADEAKKAAESQKKHESEHEQTEQQIREEQEKIWGVGANVKFCEDVFLTADKIMIDSCGGKDYCSVFFSSSSSSFRFYFFKSSFPFLFSFLKSRALISCVELTTLAITPAHQRHGYGTQLLLAGLAQADEMGIQTILAASPEGEPLYRRFGFEEVDVMNLKLWEYENGEAFTEESGMGWMRHVIMRRPAVVPGA